LNSLPERKWGKRKKVGRTKGKSFGRGPGPRLEPQKKEKQNRVEKGSFTVAKMTVPWLESV